LNDVFNSTGTPLDSPNFVSSFQNAALVFRLTL